MTIKPMHAIALAFAGILAAGPVLAEKPSWADDRGGKGRHEQRDDKRGHDRQERKAKERDFHHDRHFGDRHRVVVREYYDNRYKSGRCPPGLAKKHNGCMPPGQAKKWQVGHRLPHDVIFYDVPHRLVIELGVPPRGYRYVRVASDILMIAIGTALVVDAIEDLGR